MPAKAPAYGRSAPPVHARRAAYQCRIQYPRKSRRYVKQAPGWSCASPGGSSCCSGPPARLGRQGTRRILSTCACGSPAMKTPRSSPDAGRLRSLAATDEPCIRQQAASNQVSLESSRNQQVSGSSPLAGSILPSKINNSVATQTAAGAGVTPGSQVAAGSDGESVASDGVRPGRHRPLFPRPKPSQVRSVAPPGKWNPPILGLPVPPISLALRHRRAHSAPDWAQASLVLCAHG
jgi:hypothetical protein